MRKRIKRISVIQTATVSAVLYGAMGLLFVPLIFLARMVGGSNSGLFGVGLGLVGALMIPVIYAIGGFVVTAIGCALYNVVASVTGGIEFDLEDAVSGQ